MALLAVTVGLWAFLWAATYVMDWTSPTYGDAVTVVLGEIFGQPGVVVGGLLLMVIASIFITRGAVRNQAWAHWGAIALIAISMLPIIQVALFFRETVIWLAALAYCAVCAGFFVAMTYAYVRHGPWGVSAQRLNG